MKRKIKDILVLKMILSVLYLGEGTKWKGHSGMVLGSSDPNIILLYIKLLEICYGINHKKLKCRVSYRADQNLKSLRAQVAQQAAIVQQLTITAPFTGQLGVSNVYPGQYLNPGDVVTTLQSLDPIYVDFYLPQNTLSQLKVKQIVNFTIDAYPHQTFTSKITTINPVVDKDSRNIKVEATATNTQHKLLPGMFVNVAVQTGNPQPYLTVPQSAISFNPYGSISYVIKDQGNDKSGKPILVANQVFVITGEARGDQITVQQGLKKGDVIVTSGQLKLKNGSLVAINNSTQLANNPSPDLSNDHGG